MKNDVMMDWINAGQTVLPTLLLKHYRKFDLSNNELVLILQLKSYMDAGDPFPSTKKIAQNMRMSEENVFRAIHQLTQKKVLSIETTQDENKVTQDAYSLSLLWEKLIVLLKQEQKKEESVQEIKSNKNLYSIFEAEFGRPLSPMEMQSLVIWVEEDKYSPELIQMALREAVLSQVYSFKYIDRILLSWEKKNIRTKEQVEKESKSYRERAAQNQGNTSEDDIGPKVDPVPMINWLKDLNND